MTDIDKFNQTIADLESGKVRVAEKVNGEWKVNSWVKEVILSGFRLGKMEDMSQGQGYNIYRTNLVCYVISKQGDTYASIGKAFDISERWLRKFNDVDSKYVLTAGSVVYIERKADRWRGGELMHTVRKGETLRSISQSYGIRMGRLAWINRIRPKQQLAEGKILKLR